MNRCCWRRFFKRVQRLCIWDVSRESIREGWGCDSAGSVSKGTESGMGNGEQAVSSDAETENWPKVRQLLLRGIYQPIPGLQYRSMWYASVIPQTHDYMITLSCAVLCSSWFVLAQLLLCVFGISLFLIFVIIVIFGFQ